MAPALNRLRFGVRGPKFESVPRAAVFPTNTDMGTKDMKCRACWTDKAYIRDVRGWRGTLYRWLGMVPLKCHHCYHKFSVSWFSTIGKRLTPPAIATRPAPAMSTADKYSVGDPRSQGESTGKALRGAA